MGVCHITAILQVRWISTQSLLNYVKELIWSLSLTHWGRVTHICVSKLTIIGSDNCLSPGRRQAIIWTNAGILLIGSLGTNFSEILIEISAFSFKKMHLKMSSGKWRPSCLGLNVLMSMILVNMIHIPALNPYGCVREMAFLRQQTARPYNPYKLCNHNRHTGIIIFPHIDGPQSTMINSLT